jgi:hypothetical protein
MRTFCRAGLIAMGVLLAPATGWCSEGGPVQASVSVDNFALVERAPVRNGFAPFTIEATGLLPASRKRESFTPTEDEHFYTLRRTVERFLQRKEIPQGWSQSSEAKIAFDSELGRFRAPDGLAYAVEGELVVRGNSAVPLGLSLTAPADGIPLRYSAGLIIADQVVMMQEGLLDPTHRTVRWMVSLRPSGTDAAIPVRAVFAVRAESDDPEVNRKSLTAVTATLTSSSDGRPAMAERANDASEWLKPTPVFLKPGQGPGDTKGAKPAKAEKKAEGGGHH